MINWFIEAIYEFYENPNNLAEFEEWRKSKGKEKEDEHLYGIHQNGEITHRNNKGLRIAL